MTGVRAAMLSVSMARQGWEEQQNITKSTNLFRILLKSWYTPYVSFALSQLKNLIYTLFPPC